MKSTVFACFFLAIQVAAAGQEARHVDLPPVYEIVSDTIRIDELGSTFLQLLEDKSGQWTIEEVMKRPIVQKFHAIGEKPVGIDTNTTNTYWYRFRLKNTMTREARIALGCEVEFYDLYVFKWNILSAHYRSGSLRHWSEKDGLKSTPGAIPLVLQAGEEITIYERKQSNKPKNLPIPAGAYLQSTEELIQERYIDYVESRTHIYREIHLQEMFVVGFMFLTFFINLFCFWTVGDRAHLYFALYALSLCIIRFYNLAWDYFWWNAPEYVQYVNLLSFTWFFIDWFFIQFFREFFNTKTNYPRWDRWLFVVLLFHLSITGITHFLHLNFESLHRKFLPIMLVDQNYLIPLSIMIPLLTFVRGSDKSFLLVKLGAFPVMLLILLLGDSSGLGILLFPEIFEPIMFHFRLLEILCVSWLVLSFTWVLFTRYAQTRKDNVQRTLDNERLAMEKELERSQLIEAQKIELVKEVEERTKELRQSLAHLDVARARAERERRRAEASEAFKSRFLANMSHEIRTPLHGISGFTDLLLETSLSEKQRRWLSSIHHSTDRLGEVVNDILDLSKLEAGEVKLRQITFSPARVVADVQDALSIRAEKKDIDLILKIDENIPEAVIGDPTRLYQILMNLAGNAVKFTERGSVSLAIERVTPSHPLHTETLQFKVTDTGIGIPPEKLATIFDSFQQAGEDTTARFGGTGLGLTIARELVQLYGSDINVESEVGRGSTFSFVLQLPWANAADLDQEIIAASSLFFDNPLRILLTDDNALNREIATEAIRRHFENAEIIEAANGKEAVEMLEAARNPDLPGFKNLEGLARRLPDLVLMDMQMPEMSGTEAARYIRQHISTDIPIIALTASATPEEIENALQSGMNRHLGKPFKPRELAQVVAEVLGLEGSVPATSVAGMHPAPAAKAAGTDLAFLRDFCDGDETQMQHFIQKFLVQYPLEIKRLEDALEMGDRDALYQAAHSFRPQLEFVGLTKASELSLQLEQNARTDFDRDNFSRILSQMKQLLEDLPPAIKWIA